MNILVTGAIGYIESHNQIKKITKKELTFYRIDVTDENAMDTVFRSHTILAGTGIRDYIHVCEYLSKARVSEVLKMCWISC